MKNIFILFSLLTLIVFSSCEDKINVDDMLNYPPTIVSVNPKTSVKVGSNFNIKVMFADGPGSPLSSAVVILKDAAGNEIAKLTKTLTGTKDSVVIQGSSFNASSLSLGDYNLTISAVDVKNNLTESVTVFKIANQLYPANNDQIYIAGAFNGWSADALELIGDNTWEIRNVDLQGGGWKLKNTEDWSDQDWGDKNCDGIMEVKGDNDDTKCGFSGLVNIRFNDETLKYSVVPAVNYKTGLSGLYLLGTFNSFQGPDPKFTLVADNIWEIAEFRLKAGDVFKFSEGPNFQGKNYGDAQFDGKAEEFGPNIVLPQDFADAYYKISFNDANRNYSFEVVRYPYPENLYLVGGSTSADWSPENSIPFVKTGDGKFEIYAYITVDGFGFKALEVKDWAGDWGKSKTEDGKIVQNNEDNFTVSADGFYRVTVDFTNSTYNVQVMNWGIIGDGSPGGWDNDTDMTFVGGKGSYKWTKTITLTSGDIKFRANDGWDVNLGDNGGDGTLEYNGASIGVSAGTYVVELILDPVNGYSYTITPQ